MYVFLLFTLPIQVIFAKKREVLQEPGVKKEAENARLERTW